MAGRGSRIKGITPVKSWVGLHGIVAVAPIDEQRGDRLKSTGGSVAICNANIVSGSTIVEKGCVVAQEGLITSAGYEKPPSGFKGEIIDARGGYLSAGFIDLHLHGACGVNFLDGREDSVRKIQAAHARYGTTAVLATLGTAPIETLKEAISCLKTMINGGRHDGLLGIHLEGPYINRLKSGAQPVEQIRAPDWEELSELVDLAGGHLKIVTLAPEIKGGLSLVEMLQERGIIPAIGHSNASVEESEEAFAAGVRYVVHLFNAMSVMHHRFPGLAAAALLDDDVVVELIADGVHVDPRMLRLALRVKRWDNVVLVTDCIEALDSGAESFTVWGRRAKVFGDAPRFDDGVLCGTILTLNEALKNILRYTGRHLTEVIKLATINPARVLGIDTRKGSVEKGKDADLVVFDDDLAVQASVINGKIVYNTM
jgi:N-acetylglucosamine-6-phosphate deacetylase